MVLLSSRHYSIENLPKASERWNALANLIFLHHTEFELIAFDFGKKKFFSNLSAENFIRWFVTSWAVKLSWVLPEVHDRLVQMHEYTVKFKNQMHFGCSVCFFVFSGGARFASTVAFARVRIVYCLLCTSDRSSAAGRS